MRKISLMMLVLLLTMGVKAQDEKFKALFMYNFTKYLEWPQAKQAGDFTIGVIGNSPIVGELNAIAARKSVGAQKIVVKEISASDDVSKLHIVFVPEKNSDDAAQIASKTKSKGVLLITDKNGLGQSTSGINFIKKDGKQSFEINNKHINEGGLKAAAQLALLGVAID